MGLAVSREIQENTTYLLTENIAECDIVIDFSSPAALPFQSQAAFAEGALKAAAFLKTQPAGYYTMKDLVYASC